MESDESYVYESLSFYISQVKSQIDILTFIMNSIVIINKQNSHIAIKFR